MPKRFGALVPSRLIVACSALVTVLTLATACGQTAGQPRPHDPTAITEPQAGDSKPTTTSTVDATPSVTLPTRPQQIHMNSAGDPCALLTNTQQQQFNVNRVLYEDDSGFGQPGCTFKIDATQPYYGFTVTPRPDFDTRRLLTGEMGRWFQAVTVAGFPAVESRPGGTRDATNISCFVNVDVAEGQSLEVQSLLNSTDAFTADEMCEKTRLVAEAAMVTLLSKQ